MLEGFGTRFVARYAEAAPILQRAVAAIAKTPFEAPGISRGSTLGSNAAAELWDALARTPPDPTWGEELRRMRDEDREDARDPWAS